MLKKFLIVPMLCAQVMAEDLGVFGEIFEIQEMDLLEQILFKLRALQENGQLEREKEKVVRRVRDMISHPMKVEGIKHAQKTREYKFDPTITVTRDLYNHRKLIFANKGEKFNPLDKLSLTKPLLFIDGEEEKQIQWALRKVEANGRSKIILINGYPLKLQERLQRDIFFDQQGVLTKKLGIRNVPAIVFQKAGEKVLTVIEETVNED